MVSAQRLGPDDAGEVLTLQRAGYVPQAQDHGDLDLPPLRQTLAELVAELDDPAVMALGYRDASGRLIATVRARIGDGSADIGRLVVVPDQQGRGHGTALLAELEQRLPGEVRTFRLFTGEHSVANLRLYARLGYRETARTRAPAGYDLVHLVKDR